MTLIRMALTNYRCFTQRVDIELLPITVILGRNNSGKSALTRAPLVCDTGIHSSSPTPLDLDLLSEEIVESFTDLVFGNRPHGNIDIELEVADGINEPIQLNSTIQNIDEYRTQVVSSFDLQIGSDRLTFVWEPDDPPEKGYYTVSSGDMVLHEVPTRFQGLLPNVGHELEGLARIPELLSQATQSIRDGYPHIRYFGPFRDRPQRRYLLPTRMPTDLGISGTHAVALLASDTARQQGKVTRQVNQLLSDHLPGWSLDLVERGGTYAVMLTSEADETISVNLADVGTGVAQVLPMLVQRAVDVVYPPNRPVLEIIEQPELHLHPAAHGALAELYLFAAKNTDVRFIIETHSETFLLRLRRRIAEGLDPRTVALYFVEHKGGTATARRINIGSDGSLDYWPEGVFSEDYVESRHLAQAQLAQSEHDAN